MTLSPSYLERVREAHRRRVQFDPNFSFDVSHERDVLEIVAAVQRGERPPPQRHWHAEAEIGMCTYCDAAGAMGIVDREDEL